MTTLLEYSPATFETWPAVVPERALAAGSSETIKPDWRPVKTTVNNIGAADLELKFGAVAFTVLAGQSLSFGGPWASLVVNNPSGTLAGTYSMLIESSRRKIVGLPEFTAANGFPVYDGADPAGVVPGV